MVINEELKAQLDQLKNLISHRLISQINPNMTYQELIKYLVKMGLNKLDPSRKEKSKENLNPTNSKYVQRNVSGAPKVENQVTPKKKFSRYIPVTIKHEVYLRDKGCCSFRNQNTNQKCNSKHLLPYDHIQPMAFGGETTPENMRLLCANHHKLVTERMFRHKANEY